jgi:hypothetical protein
VSRRNQREKSCLVLVNGSDADRLMAFDRAGEGVKARQTLTVPAGGAIPEKVAGRDWRLLMSPRLDIAWMSGADVYLKLTELPSTDPKEVVAMAEMQLEKLSPLPPAQVVYGAEIIGEVEPGVSGVLLAIAPHHRVEEQLVALAARGYTAGRLDVGLARELISTAKEDGLWLVEDPGRSPGLMAVVWRVGGRWRQVDSLRVPAGPDAGNVLVAALTRMAWAAELDGWLTELPPIRLVTSAEVAETLVGPIEAWSGKPVERREPRDVARTGADSARSGLDGSGLTLMPVEVLERNRQAFVDRLWVKGLGTIGMIYLVGMVGFLAWHTYWKGELDDRRVNLKGLAPHYTNALRLKDQVQIMEEQVNLRFAALDCWKAAVEKLPPSMTLNSLNFIRGKTLRLDGTVDPSQREEVTKYNSDLLGVQVREQALFSTVKPAQVVLRGSVATWNFEAELNRLDAR